jgi:SNF2 family DNA or RNA helicase
MSLTASEIEVDGTRIVVHASLADMIPCIRAGGQYNSARNTVEFPATPAHARVIKAYLQAASTTARFDALLGPIPSRTGHAVQIQPPEKVPERVAPAEPEIELPPGLTTRPWRHQLAAFRFCMERMAAGYHGLLLACGMGTGKSLVACHLILHLNARRVLIVCPLRVVPVWVAQFERHVNAPMIVLALDEEVGSVAKKKELAAEKMKLAAALNQPYVAIINYEALFREPFLSWACTVAWDMGIADEIHRAKAPGGRISLAMKRLRAHMNVRVGLTGTPMPHGPMDIYAIFRFLDGRVFGPSFAAFRQEYAVMGGYQRKQITGFQNLEKLEALMNKITFRVGKNVLDLPSETHLTYHCLLSPEAQRIYDGLHQSFVAGVKEGTITATNALVKLLREAQITGGSVKDDNGVEHRIDHSKQKLLADTLEDMGPEEPVVVFCRFHADLDAVHEACEQHGFTSMELSGRRDELKRWQAGEGQVLAVQISAGGIGVDLTRARYSIYYSLSFSLGEYDQSLSRVHRPGQTRPVEHIHLLARSTVDVKIMRALEKRADVVDAILAEIRNS